MSEANRPSRTEELGLSGIVELASGYQRAQVLFAANELGLFELLSYGPKKLEEISGALKIDRRGLAALLDACAALKLLRLSNGRYENSRTAGLFLVPGRETSFNPVLRFWQQFSYGPWGRLDQAVRTHRPQTAAGPKPNDLFEQLVQEPEQLRLFFDGLAGLAYWSAKKIAEIVPFDRHRHLLDLGGGSGAFSAVIAARHPHLRVTLFDLEPVCALARERFARLDEHRLTAIAGNFHRDPLPADTDCVLLSNVLHDWSPDECLRLLTRVYQSLPPGGELLIYEVMAAEDQPGREDSLFSLALVLDTNQGRVYRFEEIQAWLQKCGFQNTEREPITSGTALIRSWKT
jgi:ubiquinone/menaquinone biosynthesis C-methylase UbiE